MAMKWGSGHRWLCLFMLAAVGVGSLGSGPAAADQGEMNIRFRWAFGALAGGEQKVTSLGEKATLRTGDKLKMMVDLQSRCFVYVFYQNAQGEMAMLFPYTLEQFSKDYATGKRYGIPQGEAWFEFDEHPGVETFYLMASNERLTDMEYLFGQYSSAEPDKRKELARQMVAEIRSLGREHYAAQVTPPQQMQMATRGFERAQGRGPADISALAEEIRAVDFYARTFTIEHRP